MKFLRTIYHTVTERKAFYAFLVVLWWGTFFATLEIIDSLTAYLARV